MEPSVADNNGITSTATTTIHDNSLNDIIMETFIKMDKTKKSIMTTAAHATKRASSQLIEAATLPLIPKDMKNSFMRGEFFSPETMEALTTNGLKMAENRNC